MATNKVVGAALAALFSLGLGAQEQNAFEQHMAAAKLAQTRGEYATALKELREAQAVAPADQREQVQRQVRDLADSMGVPVGQDPKAGDPVRRLIAVLDTGSYDDPAVKSAYDQVNYLESLVVPQLLEAVPTFGPFGLRNALQLLAQHDDPRIAQVLRKRLDDADPAVTAAIVKFLDDAKPVVVVPVAEKVAAISKDLGQLMSVLKELVVHDRENPAARAVAERLLASESPKVLAELLDVIDRCTAAWVSDVLDRLRQRGSDETRAVATYHWLRRQSLTEDQVLATLQTVPAGDTCWVAGSLMQQHPDWNRVALLALRSAGDAIVRKGRESGLPAISPKNWGDLRDEAGDAMFALFRKKPGYASQLYSVARSLIEAGWILPDGRESDLLEVLSHRGGEAIGMLLQALPKDDEARGLRAWKALPPTKRLPFAVHVAATRQWPRVLAAELLASERNEHVYIHRKLFDCDWTGAPREVFDSLAELAKRWPTPPPGSSGWQPALVSVWERTPQMPAEVILPFVEGGDRQSWNALLKRDPERALTWLRASSNREAADPLSVIEMLRRFGTEQDVALGVWVVHQLGGNPPNSLSEFFADHGRGNVDVIALGRMPVSANPTIEGFCMTVAYQAGRGARIEDLDALLTMAPDLGSEAASAVLNSLRAQVRPTDVDRILEALKAALTRAQPERRSPPSPLTNSRLAAHLLLLIEGTKSATALPQLRALLEHEGARDLQHDIANTCLAIGSGEQRKALLATFLDSSNPKVVATVLAAEEFRTDAQLRAHAKAAILRLGTTLDMSLGRMALEPKDLEELAVALIHDGRFLTMNASLAKSLPWCLQSRKDTTHLNPLVRATTHPSYQVREAAALALGTTFSREAAPFLIELLKDDVHGVQKAAQNSLDRIANYLEERKKWEERLK